MAITFVNAGTYESNASGVTPGAPADIVTDDVLILIIESEAEDGTAESANADWTLIGTGASDTSGFNQSTRLTAYYHVYDGTAPDYAIPDAGNHTSAVVTAWRGVDTTSPINVSNFDGDATEDTSTVITGATTTSADCMILVCATSGTDTGGSTIFTTPNPTNATLGTIDTRVNDGHSLGSDGSLYIGSVVYSSAAATGDTTITADSATREATATIALEPSGGGGGSSYTDVQRMAISIGSGGMQNLSGGLQ